MRLLLLLLIVATLNAQNIGINVGKSYWESTSDTYNIINSSVTVYESNISYTLSVYSFEYWRSGDYQVLSSKNCTGNCSISYTDDECKSLGVNITNTGDIPFDMLLSLSFDDSCITIEEVLFGLLIGLMIAIILMGTVIVCVLWKRESATNALNVENYTL